MRRPPEGKPTPQSSAPPVGAVRAALDRAGRLAAGTSTGGMTNKKWGRIGDSPVDRCRDLCECAVHSIQAQGGVSTTSATSSPTTSARVWSAAEHVDRHGRRRRCRLDETATPAAEEAPAGSLPWIVEATSGRPSTRAACGSPVIDPNAAVTVAIFGGE